MKKNFLAFLISGFLFISMQAHAQQVDSAAIVKSQKRIESNLNDANKLQRKIDKKQHRIDKQEKRINRKERKRDRKMNRIENEQDKIKKATTEN